jgi:hypothetical protein
VAAATATTTVTTTTTMTTTIPVNSAAVRDTAPTGATSALKPPSSHH